MIRTIRFLELRSLKKKIRDRLVFEKIPYFEYLVSVFDLSIIPLFLKKCSCNFLLLESKGEVLGFIILFRNRIVNIMSFKKGFGRHLLSYAEKEIFKDYNKVVLFSGSSTDWFLKNDYVLVSKNGLLGNRLMKGVQKE